MSKKKVVCDFCSDANPCARLLCTDIGREVDIGDTNVHFESVGDWGACITCYELIERRRKIQLVNRSFKGLIKQVPGFAKMRKSDQNRLRSELSNLQDMFWKSWTGMVEPIENPRHRRR